METQTASLESVQEVRLLALLHDLVRQEGQTGAAAVLGVHRKTVAAAVNSGRLSRRMQDALGRHLLAGQATAAPTASVAEARRQWEQHLAAALRRQREELLAAISAQGQQLRDAAAQRTQALEQRLAALESHRQEGDGTATVPGTTTASPSAGAPVVTVEPAPGEVAVYGVAAGTGRAGRGGRPVDRRARGGAAAGTGVGPDRGAPADPATGDVSLGRAHAAARGRLAPADLGARPQRAPPGGMAAPPAPGAHAGLVVNGTAAGWLPHARKHLVRGGRNPLSFARWSRNTETVFRLCQVFPP